MKILHVLFLIFVLLPFSVSANQHQVDITGFEEMTPDEFLEISAGKTFTGVYRGKKLVESYTQNKIVNGDWSGEQYSGRWTAGENNCFLLTIDMGGGTMCWKLLYNDGKYIFAKYTSDETNMTTSYYVTLTD